MATQTSIEAYTTLEEEFVTMINQQGRILKALELADLTRNELSMKTGVRLSSLCGRVKELLKAGLIVKFGVRRDKVTGRTNEVLALRQ